MTSEGNLTTPQKQQLSIPKRMVHGALIGLAIISFFVFGVDHPHPAWGEYWRIRPLLVTPLAGAMAGLCFYYVDHLRVTGWLRIAALIVGVIGYVIALWLGTVLGLAGTMWN